jgi:glucose-1-phosphate thymidylyltransferase
MIYHPIRQLTTAGISEILVVTSREHMGHVVSCLGSGEHLGVSLTFRVQETAGGIAHALALAEGFAGGDRVCVFLGDNVFEYSIAPYAQAFEGQERGARVVLKEVGDPTRFGIAALDETQVIEIEEKPSKPKTALAVIGLYFYDSGVFEIIRGIAPSERGELEITSVNNVYISRGELEYDICRGGWSDAGTFESYHEASAMLMRVKNEVRAR